MRGVLVLLLVLAGSVPAQEICDDGIDNDQDGFTDCDDFDCDGDPACAGEICDDGIDNDQDGFTDCDDFDCDGDPACAGEICDDGIDNDQDGFTDCDDFDCDGDPACAGEGASPDAHTADRNGDKTIDLSELLRVIQFYNSSGLGCEAGTEDGYAPEDPDQGCPPHSSDYNPQDWTINLSELLRLIQFYNSSGYTACIEGEDGFCPA